MDKFVKEGNKFLFTNGHGFVFGELFMLEDGLYYYADRDNTVVHHTYYSLKCIQEKLLELNSFKKQKYGFNDHMEPKQHVKPIKIKETQDLVVNFLYEENGDIVCANDYGFVFGKIVEVECFKTSKKTYAYFPINNTDVHFGDELLAIYEKINCLNESLDKKIVSCETNIEIQEKLEELNKKENYMDVFHEYMTYLILEENKKDNKKESDIKEVLNQRQKTHGEFSEVSKTYSDFIKILEKTGFFDKCEDHHRLAVDVIFQKLARILNGDMNFHDHWVDICGYSELVKKELDKKEKKD